jgi:Lar family restriction alleviation protein
MNKELKPCPFCGGEATLYDYEESRDIYDKETLGYVDTEYFTKYGVDCEFCGCIVADRNSEAEAIEAWNTRKPIDNIVEQLEKSSWWTPPTYDEDGYCNDDSEDVVELDTAIEIVKGGGDE